MSNRVTDFIYEATNHEKAVKDPKKYTLGHVLSAVIVSTYFTSVLLPLFLFVVGIIAAIKLI